MVADSRQDIRFRPMDFMPDRRVALLAYSASQQCYTTSHSLAAPLPSNVVSNASPGCTLLAKPDNTFDKTIPGTIETTPG